MRFFMVFFSFLIFIFHPLQAIDFHEKLHAKDITRGVECVLGIDIGGTNSDFGFFKIENKKPVFLFSLHSQTKQIKNFTDTLVEVLQFAMDKYDIFVNHVCIGSPGPRSENRDYSAEGRKGFCIDGKDIKQKTGLKTALVLNDFEIIGYGVDLIDSENFIIINKGQPVSTAPKAIIGAGTGLGTAFMIWNADLGRHDVVPSEFSSAPFAAWTSKELEFAHKNKRQEDVMLNWNDVLGGYGGIKNLFKFLVGDFEDEDRGKYKHFKPSDVFAGYGTDAICTDAVDWYLQLTARYARTVSFAVLPRAGFYIAGGIVAKNKDQFLNGVFLGTFLQDPIPSFWRRILSQIPVYLISDYNVSLYGAAQYLLYELQDIGDPILDP